MFVPTSEGRNTEFSQAHTEFSQTHKLIDKWTNTSFECARGTTVSLIDNANNLRMLYGPSDDPLNIRSKDEKCWWNVPDRIMKVKCLLL